MSSCGRDQTEGKTDGGEYFEVLTQAWCLMRCKRDCKASMVDRDSFHLCSCATFFYIIVVVSNALSQNTHLSLIFGSTLEIFLFLHVD